MCVENREKILIEFFQSTKVDASRAGANLLIDGIDPYHTAFVFVTKKKKKKQIAVAENYRSEAYAQTRLPPLK